MSEEAARPVTLVVATNNTGKLAEIRRLLGGYPVELLRPVDVLGRSIEVIEDGNTFQANAALKARAVGTATGCLTLADDSGLEVDVLDGLPGVRSARFAGDGARDSDNNSELLRRLGAFRQRPFTARFRCAVVLYEPQRDWLKTVSGSCEGWITLHPKGTAGFGYDPLFVVDGENGRTMAELEADEKNRISHRGKALRAILPELLNAISVRNTPQS